MPRAHVITKGCTMAMMLLFLASPVLSRKLHPGAYEGGRSRSEQHRTRRNTSSAAVMLGEMRTAMSDIVFIKTERYLDNGVAYMPHVGDEELMSVSGNHRETEHDTASALNDRAYGREDACGGIDGDGQAHDHSKCDHAGTPTIIPTTSQDFRGLIGRLHREVKPWRDPSMGHDHSDGRELLPWFRVMTVSDPNYVRGYGIGGWWLASQDRAAALKFLAEGIRNNPNAFQLHYTRGSLLLRSAREGTARGDEDAISIFREALSSYKSALELALAERAHVDLADPLSSGWTDYMEEDAWAAGRMSMLLEQRYGDAGVAVELAQRCTEQLGPDPTFSRVMATPIGGAGTDG